jgi:hypothetical protein
MQLSPNFTLAELTHSDIAVRRGLDNTPDADSLENLKMLCAYLELVRDILRAPIIIHSGYRSLKVNIAIGGSSNSAHMRGEAADFTAPQYGTPQEVAKKIIASDIMFDQLIYEGTWVHFGINGMMRRQVLTAHFSGGRATYTNGIA